MRIVCPEHGEFWQKPSVHIADNGHGCPICKESSLERNIRLMLDENQIKYIVEQHFIWLDRQHFDFYLPQYNLAIECQGKQHFIEGGWNNKKSLSVNIERDTKKKEKSIGNINLIYCLDSNISKKNVINNEKYNFIYTDDNTFQSKEKILDYLKTIQCSLVDRSEFSA